MCVFFFSIFACCNSCTSYLTKIIFSYKGTTRVCRITLMMTLGDLAVARVTTSY